MTIDTKILNKTRHQAYNQRLNSNDWEVLHTMTYISTVQDLLELCQDAFLYYILKSFSISQLSKKSNQCEFD